MATVTRRQWTTKEGDAREGWVLRYSDRQHERHQLQFPTKAEAERERRRVERELDDGTHTPAKKSVTLKVACDMWLDYVENVRPRFGCADHPALWVTERGGRVKPAEINARFVAYRDALGLPQALVPHSIRHSYVSHLTEDGVDRRFIQVNVGHEADSSTAIYTHVSDDFMNTALRKALAPALEAGPGKEG